MCLGIPGEVVVLNKDGTAEVQVKGVNVRTRVDLVPDVKLGDWVMMHTGFALQILDKEDALETLSLLEEAGLI